MESTYERNGVSNLFLCFAPLENWRQVDVTDHRKSRDFATCLRTLVDVHVPQAEKIVLVLDNVNTHSAAALYHTFEPHEARWIWNKREVHDTPKYGSWLNMAAFELSTLVRHCLDRRIPDQDARTRETAAWVTRRNTAAATVEWRFATSDARIKRKNLYLTINPA